MLDTIRFYLYEGSFHVENPQVFSPSLNALDLRNPDIWGVRLNCEIPQLKDSPIYYPKVTAFLETKKGQPRRKVLKIECSVSKLIKGENLFSIREDSGEIFFNKMSGILDVMGIQVSPEAIANSRVCGLHVAHNMIVAMAVSIILDDLSRAVIPDMRVDVSKSKINRHGYALQHYTQAYDLAFYDKKQEIADTKYKKTRPIDMPEFSSLDIYEEYLQDFPYNIFRMEFRMNKSKEVNKQFRQTSNTNTFKNGVLVKDVFNNELIKTILNNKWNDVVKRMTILPAYRRSTHEYYDEIMQKNSNIRANKKERLIPIVMMLSEKGAKHTRKFLKSCYGDRKAASLIKDALELKVGKHKPGYLKYISKELKKFVALTPTLLTDAVNNSKLKLTMKTDNFEFLTVKEVAKLLKVETITVQRHITKYKTLTAYKFGKEYRIYRQDLQNFISRNKVK